MRAARKVYSYRFRLGTRCCAFVVAAASVALALRSVLLATSLSGEPSLGLSDPLQRILLQQYTPTFVSKKGEKMISEAADCFRYNSVDWLQGPRLGNSNDSMIDPFLSQRMILSSVSLSRARSLLSQTICHTKSPFVSLQPVRDENMMVRYWMTRLVFLALHAHQQGPALREAEARRSPSCVSNKETKKETIGPFDFECPDAKFLVVRLFSNGIGANMRLGAVPAYMAGLATDRVVLFVNNAPVGPDFIRNSWSLVSCPRGDMQCFFMPSTPCVVTHKELEAAPVLRKDEVRLLFRNGTILKDRQRERVLILRLSFRPQREPEGLRRSVYQKVLPVAQTLVQGASDQEHIILQAAKRLLRLDTPSSGQYNYYGANSPLFHGILLYAMRPSPRSAVALQSMVKDTLHKDFDHQTSIGLPIRATDKCNMESECFAFSRYLRSLNGLWQYDNSPASVVVTTESKEVIRELELLVANAEETKILSFPANFIVNNRDVLQGTGFLQPHEQGNYTQESAMLSAIAALKLQMATSLTVGNCCSNFHLLLSDFLSEGCGVVTKNTFTCLQDHPDPQFRLCCQWDKTEECIQRRNASMKISSY